MLSVRLPVELSEAVEAVATNEGLSKSDLVRELLESRTFFWQRERRVEEVAEVAPSLEDLERFLADEIARERELLEAVGESLARLDRWHRYVQDQRERTGAQVRDEVAGGIRAGIDQRQMQLEEK